MDEYGREVLLTPGPVMMHERVVRALSRQAFSHRSEEFRRVLDEVRSLLAGLAGGGEPLVLTGSGTLAVESMAWSLVGPGDNVLLVSHGEFGERLGDTLRKRGAAVTELAPSRPGEAVDIERVEAEIETGIYDAVALVYTETSMGLSYRAAERIAEKAHSHGAVVIVDAVSGFAGEHVPPPGKVDAIATASQKALAGPPGLSFVIVSEDAARLLAEKGAPPGTPNYLDLGKVLRFHRERRETPYTAAVTLMPAMAEALRLIAETGLEEWIRRHRRRAEKLYTSIPGKGLEPLVENPEYRAWTLAAFRTPVPSSLLAKALLGRGVRVARGMGPLRDEVIRISTMGWSPDEVFDKLPGLVEEALEEAKAASAAQK